MQAFDGDCMLTSDCTRNIDTDDNGSAHARCAHEVRPRQPTAYLMNSRETDMKMEQQNHHHQLLMLLLLLQLNYYWARRRLLLMMYATETLTLRCVMC